MAEYHLNLIVNPGLTICTSKHRFEPYDHSQGENDDLRRSRQWVTNASGGWAEVKKVEDIAEPLAVNSENIVKIAVGIRNPNDNTIELTSIECYTIVCRKVKQGNSSVMTASPFFDKENSQRMTVFANKNYDGTPFGEDSSGSNGDVTWYTQTLGPIHKRPDYVHASDLRSFELAVAVT